MRIYDTESVSPVGHPRRGHIGFSGPRNGMTLGQRFTLDHLLRQVFATYEWLHHGSCAGADAEVHDIAAEHGLKVCLHPPLLHIHRAPCVRREHDLILDELSYPQRNRCIVDMSDVLIATPREYVEVQKSGTWSTWRYAKSAGKPTYLILPSGFVKIEGERCRQQVAA